MHVSLLTRSEAEGVVVLCETNPRTASKHVAACEMARKAYLHSVYGFQPTKGRIIGVIKSAVADGSIIVVEMLLRYYSFPTGMFELPFHIFKKHGLPFTPRTGTDIDDLVGRTAVLTVTGRSLCNGIFLSNVTAIHITGKQAHMKQ